MRVDWALVCRYVEIHDGLATMVGAGIDIFAPTEFPAQFAVTTAVRFVGQPDDVHDPAGHSIVVRIIAPDFSELGRLETTMNVGPSDMAIPGWENGMIVPMVHNFEAVGPGPYNIDIAIDGRSHTVSIYVREPATPAS